MVMVKKKKKRKEKRKKKEGEGGKKKIIDMENLDGKKKRISSLFVSHLS